MKKEDLILAIMKECEADGEPVTREEAEEELEELENQLDMLNVDEPEDILSLEHDEWEDEVSDLEERIRDIEEEIRNKI